MVRCSHNDAGLLGIDRDAEHHNTDRAARAGVGPAVVEYRPDLQMLVIDFVPGDSLVDESFADPDVLTRAASAVRRLHDGPRFDGDFDMFARRATYLATVMSQGITLPRGYDDFEDDWGRVQRALEASPRPSVPCNNDLLAANFIDDGRRAWLIDYEYSGNNDAAFELGNTATECGFDLDRTEAYVEAYYDQVTRADVARVRVQALCSAYGWALWGFIQADASALDFDFYGWGLERFEKAAAVFRGPDLSRLLEEVARG